VAGLIVLLVGGDIFQMHLARIHIRGVTLFYLHESWEIYDYGIQKKLIHPDGGIILSKEVR